MSHPVQPTLFQQALGASFFNLPAPVRSLHAVTAAVMGSIATARQEAAPPRREGVLL